MKKRLTALLLVLAVLSTLLIVPVSAASVTASGSWGSNLTWTLTEDGTLTISGTGDMAEFTYDEDTGTYNIPWDDYAGQITSVVVCEGVTSIAAHAFANCGYITSAVLEEGIVSIGDYAFCGYNNLSSLTLSDGLQTIGNSAFFGCMIESVELPDSLISMGTTAFACTRLKSVVVPAGVTSIGNGLFYGSSYLEYVIFEGSAPDVVQYEDWSPSEWYSKGYGSVLETGGSSLTVYYLDDGTWTEELQHFFFYGDRDLYPYTFSDETGTSYTINFEDVLVTNGAGEYVYTDIDWVSCTADELAALTGGTVSAEVTVPSEDTVSTGTAANTEDSFSDDTSSGTWLWAADYIYACADAGIINGYSDGTFLPDGSLTRAEAATIIARAFDLSSDAAESSFSDVSSSYQWALPYIEACVDAGIVSGYSDGTFLPGQNVTRAEMAKMLAVAEGLAADAAESSFSDVSSSYQWALPYIEACADAGIVNGYSDGTFLPAGSVTRAEAAAMIARALGLAD